MKQFFLMVGLLIASSIAAMYTPSTSESSFREQHELDTRMSLHSGIYTGDVFLVKDALLKGAALNSDDSSDKQAVLYAFEVGILDLVVLLIDAGIGIEVRGNALEDTPLHRAVLCGHKQLVELLLERGARVNVVSKCKSTPLHLAIQSGYADIVTVLLLKGAQAKGRDCWGNTPLSLAERRGDKKLTHVLRWYQ